MKQLQFMDVIKHKMQSFSVDDLFEILIYFVSGFVIGFVVKYCLRYFLWFLIFSIISLWVVQNFGIVYINYDYFKDFLGFTHNYTISDILNMMLEFIYNHIGESLGLIFGFYLSWEIL